MKWEYSIYLIFFLKCTTKIMRNKVSKNIYTDTSCLQISHNDSPFSIKNPQIQKINIISITTSHEEHNATKFMSTSSLGPPPPNHIWEFELEK